MSPRAREGFVRVMSGSSVVGSLRVLLSLDSSEFSKPLATEADKLSARLKTLGQQATDAGATLTKALATPLATMKGIGQPADADKLKRFFEAFDGGAATAEESAGRLTGTVTKLAGAISIAGVVDRAVDGLLRFAGQAIASAVEIDELATKTGLSTAAVQQLDYIARMSGGHLQQYADVVFRLGVAIEQGGRKALAGLQALGLEYAQIRAMKPEDQFHTIMKALQAIENPQERHRIGVDLMGQSYKQVSAAVRDYTQHLRDAPMATEAAIQASAEASAEIDRAWAHAKASAIDAIGAIVRAARSANYQPQDAAGSLGRVALGPMGMAFPSAAQAVAAPPAAPAPSVPGPEHASRVAADYVTRLASARHDVAQLTAEQKKQIDAALALGVSISELAAEYGVSDEAFRLYRTGTAATTRTMSAAAAAAKALADQLTGQKLAEEVATLDRVLRQIGGAAALTVYEHARLGKQLQGLYEQGAQLTPDLDRIRGQAGFTRLIGDIEDGGRRLQNVALRIPRRVADITKGFNALISPPHARLANQMPGSGMELPGAPDISGLQRSLRGLGPTILQAVSGGGNVGAAIGAHLGNDIGTHLASAAGKQTSGFFASKLGQIVTSAIPGIGALLGPLAGKLGGWIVGLFTGGEGARANDLRDSLKKQVAEAILGLTDDPAIREALDRFNTAGSQKRVQEAFDDVMAAANVARDRMQRYGLSLDDVGSASDRAHRKSEKLLADFKELSMLGFSVDQITAGAAEQLNQLIRVSREAGVQLPAAFGPFLEQLVRAGGLTEDLAAQLLGVATPVPWRQMADAAQEYGIELENLGRQYEQAKLDDTGKKIADDFKLLAGHGADVGAVLNGMSDEVQALITQGLKLGLAIPDSMRDIVTAMQEAGLLTDELGAPLAELARIQFAAPIESEMDRLIDKIGELIEALTGPSGLQAAFAGVAGPSFPLPVGFFPIETDTYQDLMASYEIPSFEKGTNGQYFDFGAGTLAMLHGHEKITPMGAGGSDSMTIVLERDGIAEARWLVPFIPDEVRRLRLA